MNKIYEPFKIPTREELRENKSKQGLSQPKTAPSDSADMYGFAEIEIVGKVKSSLIEVIPARQEQVIEPVMDEKRELFIKMRQISRGDEFRRIEYTKIFSQQDHRIGISKIFYKQAVFMKDFEDDYTEQVPFSSYFPYYQLMSYEQLRTYFTWRTQVRKGNITHVSTSYAFLYLYELINNIGVENPQDGLERIMAFREAFIVYDRIIDKYVLRWVKDYHVYYELPKSFKDFISDERYVSLYNKTLYENKSNNNYSFELYCGISKYNIKSSDFYNDKTQELIKSCFYFVLDRLKQVFAAEEISFDDIVFQSSANTTKWNPFEGALFYQKISQQEKWVVLSDKDIYTYRQNRWRCISATQGNRAFVGYIMKQMESALRKAVNFKKKLTTNINTLGGATLAKLNMAFIELEEEINDAVTEFYIGFNRKVISVDKTALEKIRQEALDIQEKLTVQEEIEIPESKQPQTANETKEIEISDEWTSLKQSLTETELKALAVILNGEDIKSFSDANGIMAEVLVDSINQKAYDEINDTVLEFEDTVLVYEEYRDKLMEMVI